MKWASVSEFARQLTHGFSNYTGEPAGAKFDTGPNNVITFNYGSISKAGKWYVDKALAAWSAVTGITFKATSFANADIQFVQSDQSGAYSANTYSGSTIVRSKVNIPTSWYAGEEFKLSSYGYQTFLHEIGHSLGLGHAGNYNGGASFPSNAKFANDSWQMSVMSYFSQTDNPNVKGSFAYVLTPMRADIKAIHTLYGVPSGADKVNSGNTTYGFNSNAKGPASQFAKAKPVMTMTIFDQGGYDTINMSKSSANQTINLASGSFSSVLGKSNNLMIYNSTIEKAVGGSGRDKIYGNGSSNTLIGNGGRDTLSGKGGSDTLVGRAGNDKLIGGAGNDNLTGGSGGDSLYGGNGRDTVNYAGHASPVTIDLGLNKAGGAANGDKFFDVENVIGSKAADNLFGNWNSNALHGLGGNDTLSGRSGNDTITGQYGRDKLFGGNGNDKLYAGTANDTLSGGEGSDVLQGGPGYDKLFGGNGNDTLYAGIANDTLSGGEGSDVLQGGPGYDKLFGGNGNDKLYAGAGNDTLDGGTGNDLLSGGGGQDTFIFNGGRDTIVGFSETQNDQIRIKGSLAPTKNASNLISNHATVENGNTVIDLGGGDKIIVNGVTNPNSLVDDISFF